MKLILFRLLYTTVLVCPAVSRAQTVAGSGIDYSAFVGQVFTPAKVKADKSAYTLFDPVSDDQTRVFSTDRPGKTHSSTTVDAGHFQIESDFVNYTYDHNTPQHTTTNAFSVGTPIFKAGVTNWADLEAGFAPYNRSRVIDRTSAMTMTGSGFGDILLGSKINLFGNEGQRQALAVLPFVKLPTASRNIGNGVTEYTVNLPYTVNLDTLWSLTLEPAFGALKNSTNNGLHGDYSMLANLNRPVFTKTVTAALEVASEYASDRHITPRYTLDPSLQWVVVPNVQLDLGSYIGLNRAAPDIIVYSGVSYRY